MDGRMKGWNVVSATGCR